MNLTEAADFLGIAGATLRRAMEMGRIVGEHPLPDGPWIFQRQALETEAAAQVVDSARHRSHNPATANPEQGNLEVPFFSKDTKYDNDSIISVRFSANDRVEIV